MNRHSPHVRARDLRRTASQLIFAWGSVLSAACYFLLLISGREPLVDDHLTATAVAMLACYLVSRLALSTWLQRAEARRRS